MAHGQITHIEFPADDVERAQRFYSELFGWQYQTIPGFEDYFMFNTGATDAIGGAIGKRNDSVADTIRLYIETDSIDALLPRVTELGGSVTREKTEIPGQGWYAVIKDSEGNEVAMYEGQPENPDVVRLIDSHAHVQASAFGHDVEAVLAAARAAGLVRIMVPGYDLESSRAALDLAQPLSVDTSAGIHPHVASDSARDWPAILELASDARVVAVGETGLDYDRGFSPREDQLVNLRRHLALAGELNKPAILHCRSKPGQRDAQDDLLRELEDAGRPVALLHSFSGPVDYGERALEFGLSISFSGLVFRAGEEASAIVARLTPADRLLIETDSPYLSPPGAPRRRNEPMYVAITARWLAEQREEDAESLGEQLVANYDRVFSRQPT